jgi:hypothetical protein
MTISTSIRSFHVVLFSLLLVSCGNKLSRGKAEELIAKNMNLPAIQTIQLGTSFLKRSWSDPSRMPAMCMGTGEKYSDVQARLDELQSKGLISVGEYHQHRGECNYLWATVALTNDGKKYLVSDANGVFQVKAYELTFGEVTGIQINEQFKVAEADYTLKITNRTPFGSTFSADPISRKATFALFDDGWRIK